MSDLGIDFGALLGPPSPRGKKGLRLSYVRDLGEGDIKALWEIKDGDLGVNAQPLRRIRTTHHTLARLIAEGRRNIEISQITGYSPATISHIQNDPAFKELVEYYKEQVAEVFVNVHERMAEISMLAAEELRDRLVEQPEDFTKRELVEVLEKTADRTGFGPQSKTTNVNVNMTFADRLSSARRRAGLLEAAPSPEPPGGVVIEGELVSRDD